MPGSLRGLIRMVLLGLTLLVLALISALTAMRIAIHRDEVEVPKLVGLTGSEAARAGENFGLAVDVESNFYSGDIPAGRVVSQTPSPGSKVRRGWRVRTALSLGPQKIAIPDVVGQSERAAEINLRRRGLEIGSVAMATLPGLEAGQIASQHPPPNANNISAPRVSLLVAGEREPASFVMPALIGETLASASEAITSAGMKLGSVTVRPSGTSLQPGVPFASPPTGVSLPSAAIVVGQAPAVGERVQEGQTISLQVQE